MTIIYIITNKINGKQYVGKTTFSLQKRFQEHIYESRRKDQQDRHRPLYLAFQKYGEENFSIEQLEEVDDSLANAREKYWIQKLNTYYTGYNATFGGDGYSSIDRAKVLELYNQGFNNTEIAKTLGHQRTTISRTIKAMGLKSQFKNTRKPVKISKNGETLTFESRVSAARYFIDHNISSSKNEQTVKQGIREAIKSQKPYFGYTIEVC